MIKSEKCSKSKLFFFRMQFSHVSDMTSEEILDYAVLYGSNTRDLNIKSFSHLEIRDFCPDDWISIFLDLMTNVLGVENPLALKNGRTTKGKNKFFMELIFNAGLNTPSDLYHEISGL